MPIVIGPGGEIQRISQDEFDVIDVGGSAEVTAEQQSIDQLNAGLPASPFEDFGPSAQPVTTVTVPSSGTGGGINVPNPFASIGDLVLDVIGGLADLATEVVMEPVDWVADMVAGGVQSVENIITITEALVTGQPVPELPEAQFPSLLETVAAAPIPGAGGVISTAESVFISGGSRLGAAGIRAGVVAGTELGMEAIEGSLIDTIGGFSENIPGAGVVFQPSQPSEVSAMTMQPGTLLPARDRLVWVRRNPMTGLQYGKLMDGRMVYQKKDGTVTVYRPEKPIVLTRNPRLGTAARAAARLSGFGKKLRKNKALRDALK